MTFYIKNHRGEWIDIDDPNLKWEKPAPRYIDPMECPHCGDATQANRRFTDSGRAACDNCKSAFEPGLIGQWIDDPDYEEYKDDPAYAEYQHIKAQWANRPEVN